MNGKRKNLLNLCIDCKAHLIFILLLSTFILFYDLGGSSLKALNEAKWAQISSEMINSGDWLTPRIRGEVFQHKPPLRMWFNTVAFYLFGENEFTIRFWSAVSGIGIIILIYILSYIWYRNALLSLASSLMLILSPFFVFQYLRVGEEHCTFAFFFLLSIYFFWLSREDKKYLYLSTLCFGLSFLTYGFAAFFSPLIIFTYLIITREIKRYNLKVFLICFLISLIVIMPWYVFQYVRNGVNFFKIYLAESLCYFNADLLKENSSYVSFLGQGLINRMLECVDETSFRGPGFYINAIKFGFFPWWISILFYLFFLVFEVLINIYKKIIIKIKKEDLFMIVWIICVLSILSAFKDKMPWRIYFMFPIFSILTAKSFQWLYKGGWVVAIAIVGMLFLLAVLSPFQLCTPGCFNGPTELESLILSEEPVLKYNFASLYLWFFVIFGFILGLSYVSFKNKRRIFHCAICFILFFYLSVIGVKNTLDFFRFSNGKSDIYLIVKEIGQLSSHIKKLIIYDDTLYKIEKGMIVPEYSLGVSEYFIGGHRWDSYYYINRLDIKKEYIMDFNELSDILRNSNKTAFLININKWNELKEIKPNFLFHVMAAKGEYILATSILFKQN